MEEYDPELDDVHVPKEGKQEPQKRSSSDEISLSRPDD